MSNSRRRVAAVAAEKGPAGLLDRSARPLESVEDLLMRARVDLAELKRTGAREDDQSPVGGRHPCCRSRCRDPGQGQEQTRHGLGDAL